MLYPLSYWSSLIVGPPAHGITDSKIIAAATFRLKRRRPTNIVSRYRQRKLALPQLLG